MCNYERMHLLNPDDFVCVSRMNRASCKNFAGRPRDQIVAFISSVLYRFRHSHGLSPNDLLNWKQLRSAWYMGYMEMLTKFLRAPGKWIETTGTLG